VLAAGALGWLAVAPLLLGALATFTADECCGV
jgi:hypothetical protein